jgi:hypothetical protein
VGVFLLIVFADRSVFAEENDQFKFFKTPDQSNHPNYYSMTTAQVEDAVIEMERESNSYKDTKKIFDSMATPYFSTNPQDWVDINYFFRGISGVLKGRAEGGSRSGAKMVLLECEYLAKSFSDEYGFDSVTLNRNGSTVADWLKIAEGCYWEKNYKEMEKSLYNALLYSHRLSRPRSGLHLY